MTDERLREIKERCKGVKLNNWPYASQAKQDRFDLLAELERVTKERNALLTNAPMRRLLEMLKKRDAEIDRLIAEVLELRTERDAAVEDLRRIIFECADDPLDFCGEVCANNNGTCQRGVAAGYGDKCNGYEWRRKE